MPHRPPIIGQTRLTTEDTALPADLPPLDTLIACPQCDTLHLDVHMDDGARAHCNRCGYLLMTERSTALARVLTLALTAFILMIAAVSFPFLDLSAAGSRNSASVLSAVFAFTGLYSLPLAVAVAGFIVLIPLIRLAAIIYAIGPLVRGIAPRAGAKTAFTIAEHLRPWSMAEIFIVGVSVALVKVAGLASVSFGPAFWAFCALVIITVLKDQFICRYSIWEALDTKAD